MNDDQLNKCLTDTSAVNALNDRVIKYSKQDSVDATPTFIVNGKKLVGDETLAQLDAAIQPLLK